MPSLQASPVRSRSGKRLRSAQIYLGFRGLTFTLSPLVSARLLSFPPGAVPETLIKTPVPKSQRNAPKWGGFGTAFPSRGGCQGGREDVYRNALVPSPARGAGRGPGGLQPTSPPPPAPHSFHFYETRTPSPPRLPRNSQPRLFLRPHANSAGSCELGRIRDARKQRMRGEKSKWDGEQKGAGGRTGRAKGRGEAWGCARAWWPSRSATPGSASRCAPSGVKCGLTWSDCGSRSLNYCGWVLSGHPTIFSSAACGARAETKTKQITRHSPDRQLGAAAGTSLTSHREAGAGIPAAEYCL